jgi:hypothetical protein
MKKYDVISSNSDLHTRATMMSLQRIQRFMSRLGRAIGRSCTRGMWTLSPDGKLRCEALRGDTCRTD